MSKGKKFDAAEKHFEKKRLKYEAEIRRLNDNLASVRKERDEFKRERDDLEQECNSLKEWVDRLLEYTELTPEEIENRVESDKKIARAASMICSFKELLGGYFNGYKSR